MSTPARPALRATACLFMTLAVSGSPATGIAATPAAELEARAAAAGA